MCYKITAPNTFSRSCAVNCVGGPLAKTFRLPQSWLARHLKPKSTRSHLNQLDKEPHLKHSNYQRHSTIPHKYHTTNNSTKPPTTLLYSLSTYLPDPDPIHPPLPPSPSTPTTNATPPKVVQTVATKKLNIGLTTLASSYLRSLKGSGSPPSTLKGCEEKPTRALTTSFSMICFSSFC